MEKIEKLFNVNYPSTLVFGHQREVPDGTFFVTSSGKNNGVAGRVEPIADAELFPAGAITVPLKGSVMQAFLQPEPFYCAHQIAVLTPKTPMSDAVKLFYVSCLRANRFRFSYGRQADKTLPILEVPSIEEIPHWVAGADLNALHNASEPLEKIETPQINTNSWKPYRYGRLFKIGRGFGPRKATLTGKGSTPFVTAIDSNNGLTGFTDEDPKHKGNVITVNRNGNGVAEAFYQPEPLSSTEDVHVFTPKFDLNKYIAMFLIPLIRKEKYRFNYGRKWGLARMNESIIQLPAKADGEPDWNFMERFVKSLPYSKSI